jgi:MFS transporter, ACS family, tartrate transporter
MDIQQFARSQTTANDAALFARISSRLIPLLIGLYILAYLDRVNVGFAALQMKRSLAFSDTVYGIGAGIFFLGYALLEVPSNLLLERVGARRWIARIMISWGLISASMAFVKTPSTFYVMRFLLGASEAGFFPGIILYLTYWFPAQRQAKAVARFMTAVAIAGIIGAPVSVAVLKLNGLLHLEGWQWIFLVEGLPSVIAGLAVIWLLTDGPDQVGWLSVTEKGRLRELLLRDEQTPSQHRAHTLRTALTSARIWLMALIYLIISMSLYAISMWLPLVLKNVSRISDSRAILFSSLPYLIAAPGMVRIAHHSDHSGHRGWYTFATSVTASLGLVVSATAHDLPAAMLGLCLAALGTLGSMGPFWALTKQFLAGTGAAGGLALVNSCGAIGGFFGPFVMGWIKDLTHSFAVALLLIAGLFLFGGFLALRIDGGATPSFPKGSNSSWA